MDRRKRTRCVPPRTFPREAVMRFEKEFALSSPTISVLLNRGMDTCDAVRRFLSPSLDDLHDPFLFREMELAVARIIKAIKERERILVYGDYDVDGVSAIALIVRNLLSLNADCSYFVPHRLREGYGFSSAHMEAFRKKGISLIITVDCGINAQKAIEDAGRSGIDVIVTDHHTPQKRLHGAYAVIDAKAEGEEYPFKELAGVGVAFKLMDALFTKLGQRRDSLVDIDLVALGTVADIVPLVGENRILAKLGMERLNETEKVGLRALIEKSRRKKGVISTYDVGYVLGPRLNASGRLESAETSIELLLTEDRARAWDYAVLLDEENRKRQELHEKVIRESIEMIEEHRYDRGVGAIVLAKDDWHEGVVGIAASKIVERYARPTILISTAGEIGKGSGRSIHAFGILDALHSCREHLTRYGGHKYAAGITIEKENIPRFREAFNAVVRKTLNCEDLVKTLSCDYELHFAEIDQKMVDEMRLLEPFGVGNPKPLFFSSNAEIVGYPRIVGTNHLKLKFRQGEFVFEAIGFDMGEYIGTIEREHATCAICYRVEENEYRQRKTIQLQLAHLEAQTS
jgi:single-stranded-DNA-specific exonuclease